MHLNETKYKCWRATATQIDGTEHLLFVGHSYEQVKRSYTEVFHDLLTDEEQANISRVNLERWNGVADQGRWVKTDSLKVPAMKPVLVSQSN